MDICDMNVCDVCDVYTQLHTCVVYTFPYATATIVTR